MEKFVDEKLHELTKHGEDEFPIALYGDSYYLYGNRFYYSHYHEEIEILFEKKDWKTLQDTVLAAFFSNNNTSRIIRVIQELK